MNLSGFSGIEIVAMPFAPLSVTLCKSALAQSPHTVHMPKGRGEIHPLLAPIRADRAVKEGVHTGIGLVEQGNQVVLESDLVFGVQTILPVHAF